ncbi:hypothetical protein T36_0956 [Helicobacter cinaedi]|uniref:hypothetical protein n=1 Tax=Helicobacter cinaedi TaxID=213 RepID=UPI001F22742F|nr:hypothetical protein [Helicobacter cinaedi]BDB64501.1 hypothetical protein T36_0956 [Helicobacter cinaedi]
MIHRFSSYFSFHRLIVAYLIFIFACGFVGCGYKADPFYKDSKADSKIEQDSIPQELESESKKKVLFQEIGSKPSASYEEDEE